MSQEQRPYKEKGNAFPPRKEYPPTQSDYYKSGEQSVEHPMARIDFCPEFLENRCHKGASCRQRHILYKDLRREFKLIHAPYKKHLCKLFEMGQKCSKPKFTCLFAHGEGDIWNSRFIEKPADEINSKKVDERFTSTRSTEKRSGNPKQDQGFKGKEEYHKVSKGAHENRDQHKGGAHHVRDEGNQKQAQEKRHMVKKLQEPIPTQCERGNKRSKANYVNPEQKKNDEENRNSKRTNGGYAQPRHASDAMTNAEFEEYMKTLNQEKEEDVWVDEEDSDSDDSDEIDRKKLDSKEEEEKEQKRQPVSKEQKKQTDYQDSQNKQEKASSKAAIKSENKAVNPSQEKGKAEFTQQKQQKIKQNTVPSEEEVKANEKEVNIKSKGKAAELGTQYKDVRSLDWNKINPEEMSTEELMKLHSACLQQLSSSSEDSEDNNEEDEDQDEDNNYGSDEEILTKKQTQNILKKEEKKDKKQQQKEQQQVQPSKNKNNDKKEQRSNNINNYNKKLSHHTNEVFGSNEQPVEGIDEMEIYAFCYFEDAVKLVDWQAQVLQTFQELKIPKNMLLVTEESKCNGQFGMLLKLRSMKIICLQLLRVNLYKNTHLKILFKLLPNPDSQIVFSKPITPVKRVNDYAFLAQDGQQCIVYNSRIEKSESENLEFKNYDFRNINENTRKLEEVITGMLNREEFEDEQFYQKEKHSGKILLGVKDSTRQFVGSYTTNNHHESFFTFLAKRLRDCHPSISTSQYSREEYRLVIAGEEENQYFPLLDMKIFALNVNKPAQKTIYQTSSGLYFQKIEEGNWPMSACLLYEKRQKDYISEEKFKFALKQLDRRYFYVMAKMANQNAMLDDQEMYASELL